VTRLLHSGPHTMKTWCAGAVRRERWETETNVLVSLEFLLAKYGIVLRDEKGQGLIEYVLIAALISVVAIIAITQVGDDVSAYWDTVDAALT
jgi:Flp pilus assembly pilin Flp